MMKIKKLEKQVYQQLAKVIDPELNVDIVSLGLIYDVSIGLVQNKTRSNYFVHILMTLTTPGCPLIGVLQQMICDRVADLPAIDRKNIDIELTFDPPWVPDMMSPQARAELGFD